jgi:hypothetical protein
MTAQARRDADYAGRDGLAVSGHRLARPGRSYARGPISLRGPAVIDTA